MRRRGLVARASFLAFIQLILAGCATPDASPDTGIEPQDAELVEAGEGLYLAHCAECHGSDLRGTDRGPSHLSLIYQPSHHGDGSFQLAVQIGARAHHWRFGDMPPVEGVSEDDVVAIVAYVREQQRLNGFEPYPPP